MLSTMGMIMISLFVLLFLVSIFFIMKSSELKGAGTTAFSSYFTNPGVTGTEISHYDSIAQNNIDKLGEITPEEAEVFLFILRFSDSMNSTEARKLAALIIDECDKYDLNPFLILAVIQVESEFTPKAVSGQGAIGLMQVMPATGKFVAKELGISYSGKIHYLSFLADRFDSTENALAAYNYGPTRYESTLSLRKSPPKYVRKVLDFKDFLEEESILLAKRS